MNCMLPQPMSAADVSRSTILHCRKNVFFQHPFIIDDFFPRSEAYLCTPTPSRGNVNALIFTRITINLSLSDVILGTVQADNNQLVCSRLFPTDFFTLFNGTGSSGRACLLVWTSLFACLFFYCLLSCIRSQSTQTRPDFSTILMVRSEIPTVFLEFRHSE